MLKKIVVDNFTVFSGKREFSFSDNLNVIIGENGTGKTHLIQLIYAILKSVSRCEKGMAKTVAERAIKEELCGIFLPDSLGRLASRVHGTSSCSVEAEWGEEGRIRFSFSTRSSERVDLEHMDYEPLKAPALFLPVKEILSVFNGFQAALEGRELLFDTTYLDLAKALNKSPLKGPRKSAVSSYLNEIEEVLGGIISLEKGNFYFHGEQQKKRGHFEATLMAEGHRKIGMLAHLLRNGSLTDNSCLLWDEPESNLNPKLIRHLASTLFNLSKKMQVFIATHSLFLLKEFDMLHQEKINGAKKAYRSSAREYVRYTGLSFNGDALDKEQGKALDDIRTIVALDEEISQSDRYLAVDAEG